MDIIESYFGVTEMEYDEKECKYRFLGNLEGTIKLERLAEIFNRVIKNAELGYIKGSKRKPYLSPVHSLIIGLYAIICSLYEKKLLCELTKSHIHEFTVVIYEWAHGKPPLLTNDDKWSESWDFIQDKMIEFCSGDPETAPIR